MASTKSGSKPSKLVSDKQVAKVREASKKLFQRALELVGTSKTELRMLLAETESLVQNFQAKTFKSVITDVAKEKREYVFGAFLIKLYDFSGGDETNALSEIGLESYYNAEELNEACEEHLDEDVTLFRTDMLSGESFDMWAGALNGNATKAGFLLDLMVLCLNNKKVAEIVESAGATLKYLTSRGQIPLDDEDED